MKILTVVLLTLVCLSCSSNQNDENTPSSGSGNGSYGSQAAENGQTYQYEDETKYTRGDLTIYMADKRNPANGQPILTEETMLFAGTMSNGEISLVLPQNVDSRFLTKIDKVPPDMEVKPLGVEVWFNTDPLRLIDNNGEHIGDLRYVKKTSDTEYHFVYYWYFSENTKINGTTGKTEYKIEATKGWKKIYHRAKILADQSSESYITTDLSKVPDGLKWLVTEK